MLKYLSDPEFSLHRTCTQLGLDMILNLAESPVLPFSPQHISKEIQNGLEALVSSNITTKLSQLDSTAAWKVGNIAVSTWRFRLNRDALWQVLLEAIQSFDQSVQEWLDMRDQTTEAELQDPSRLVISHLSPLT